MAKKKEKQNANPSVSQEQGAAYGNEDAENIKVTHEVGGLGVYANHLVVQNAPDAFHLLFYQITTPFVVGSPQEQMSAIKQLGLQAKFVTRVIVSREKMPDFVEVLQSNVVRPRQKEQPETPQE